MTLSASRFGSRSIYVNPAAVIGLDTTVGSGGSVRIKGIASYGQQGWWVQFHNKRGALALGDVPLWFGLVSAVQFNTLSSNGFGFVIPPAMILDTLTATDQGHIGISATATTYTPTGFVGGGGADGWVHILYEELDTQTA